MALCIKAYHNVCPELGLLGEGFQNPKAPLKTLLLALQENHRTSFERKQACEWHPNPVLGPWEPKHLRIHDESAAKVQQALPGSKSSLQPFWNHTSSQQELIKIVPHSTIYLGGSLQAGLFFFRWLTCWPSAPHVDVCIQDTQWKENYALAQRWNSELNCSTRVFPRTRVTSHPVFSGKVNQGNQELCDSAATQWWRWVSASSVFQSAKNKCGTKCHRWCRHQLIWLVWIGIKNDPNAMKQCKQDCRHQLQQSSTSLYTI